MTTSTDKPRSAATWLAFAVALLLLAGFVRHTFHASSTQYFDDSFMFYRYAMNLRHGFGLAWNPGGPPVYGVTSLTWLVVVEIFSLLPMQPVTALIAASTCSYMFGVWLMGRGVARHAQSHFFRSGLNALLVIALPLELSYAFLQNITNGMDTMLSFAANAGVALAAINIVRRPSMRSAVLAGLAGYIAFATRPESGICAMMVPALVWLLMVRPRRLGLAAATAGITAGLIAVQMLAARVYFHTAVPLSFYMKARHAYAGFTGYDGPSTYLVQFAGIAGLPLIALLLLARRRHLRTLACFLVPAGLTMLYLDTVTQVMGIFARYYVPLLPFFILPAVWIWDERIAAGDIWPVRPPNWRMAAAAAVFLCAALGTGGVVAERLELMAAAKVHGYPPPVLATNAPVAELPGIGWYRGIQALTDEVVAPLPAGATVAASEVGYLGAFAPKANVIDLVGLNDSRIAMRGFSMDDLLERKPDLIWMPHPDYTWLRGEILSDPRLLRQYTVIDGMYNYGLAIRKDSPLRPQMMALVGAAWGKEYPGREMYDYEVRQAAWPGGPTP